MAICHYFFDFDETLVDTSKLRPYRNTTEGRRYVAEFPEKVWTQPIDQRLIKLVNRLAESNKISIATNSAGDYTKALLKKHGFNTNLNIYDSLGKPDSQKFANATKKHKQRGEQILSIGDSASDVLAAHGCCIPSIAVAWGKTSRIDQLEQAEPNFIANAIDDLIKSIESFERGEIVYNPRKNPTRYYFIDSGESFFDPEVQVFDLGPYYPTRHELFYQSQSPSILRFKNAKDFLISEIKNGAEDKFFHNGTVRTGTKYLRTISDFYEQAVEKIQSINLQGKTIIIASPNSAPVFCYKTDINHLFCWNINKKIFVIKRKDLGRKIFRVFPKKESHLDGSRSREEHLKTIGVNSIDILDDEFRNVIIFDDITTTGNQIKAIAVILRELCNFQGNILGFVLGRTSS